MWPNLSFFLGKSLESAPWHKINVFNHETPQITFETFSNENKLNVVDVDWASNTER